jgi:hypothetical protein
VLHLTKPRFIIRENIIHVEVIIVLLLHVLLSLQLLLLPLLLLSLQLLPPLLLLQLQVPCISLQQQQLPPLLLLHLSVLRSLLQLHCSLLLLLLLLILLLSLREGLHQPHVDLDTQTSPSSRLIQGRIGSRLLRLLLPLLSSWMACMLNRAPSCCRC